MLVGISILVACAAFFAYLQLPGATSHDQVDTSTPSPASVAGAAAASQRSSSFPSLVWAFLCAGLGLSSSGRSRGSDGGGSGSSRVLGPRTAPAVSPASIQLPLLQQGSSFPLSTNSTSLPAAPVPAISDVPQMRVSSPEESPDTTPKARPTELVNDIVPSISLSVDEDDDTPPAFPAINSAQRAKTTSSNVNQNLVSSNRFNGNTSPGFSMPPPPLPQIRGRNPRSQPTVIAPSAPRSSPAALARGPASQRAPFLPGTAGGTAQAANGGVSSIGSGGLVVPPTHNAPPTKPNRKVILEPGHSPLDWARLCRTAPPEVLRGPDVPPGLLRVTPSMLAKYGRPRKPRSKEKGDGVAGGVGERGVVWMALEGKVYNITAYIPFHPGGEGELLRAAGKDGTSLFMKTHSWVNVEGMLGGCLIGILVSEEEGPEAGIKVGPGLEDVD